MLQVDVFIPLYNAEKYLEDLIKAIKRQKKVEIKKILFAITESSDKTFEIVKNHHEISYFCVKKEDFSHSTIREKGISCCESKLVIMMTQDVILKDEFSFYNLAKNMNNDIIFGFGRQISKFKNIERYIREKNYPSESYVVEKKDIDSLQLRAFFASDAFAIYDREKFLALGGYDNKKLPLSEDMYYARKCILNGYKIMYVSEAVVFHSHNFKIKELYDRYYLTGKFFKENPEFLNYKSTSTGLKLAWYVFKEIIKHFDIISLIRFFPDMLARYIGKRNGQNSKE